jgi:hypothetical protein
LHVSRSDKSTERVAGDGTRSSSKETKRTLRILFRSWGGRVVADAIIVGVDVVCGRVERYV